MKSYFISIFFYLNTIGQDTVTTVTYWNKGDHFFYQNMLQKKEWKDNLLVKNDSIALNFQLHVLDSTENGYTIQLEESNYNFLKKMIHNSSSWDIPDETINAVLIEDLHLIYKIDEHYLLKMLNK